MPNYQRYVNAKILAGDTVAGTVTSKTAFITGLSVASSGAPNSNIEFDVRYGMCIDIDYHGIITTAASPGNLTIEIDYGIGSPAAPTSLTSMGNTGAFAPPSSLTNAYWTLKGKAAFAQTGQGNNGIMTFSGCLMIVDASNVGHFYPIITPTTSGTTGWLSGVDTGVTPGSLQQVVASVTWGSSNASNSISVQGGSMLQRVN